MSAEVIQFVPRPNPNRPLFDRCEVAPILGAREFNAALPAWPDVSQAGAYHAPDKDAG